MIAREIVEENPKSSTVEVIVHIRDANDNIPVFELMEYVAYISEDVEAGTSVLKVIAYDIDSEEYGSEGIRYTELRGQISHK